MVASEDVRSVLRGHLLPDWNCTVPDWFTLASDVEVISL